MGVAHRGLLVSGFSVAVAFACGGSSSSDGAGGASGSGAAAGSSAGGSGGGTSGSAGSGGGTAGASTGGSAGSMGGAGGSGGLGGSGGGGGPPCDPPSGSGAALCIRFDPETIMFQAEPALDGSGILFVEVFDVDDPEPDPMTMIAPIANETFPVQPGGMVVESSILSLPEFRFEGLPDTVYVRAAFVDNLAALDDLDDDLTWGMFLGGFDVSVGFDEDTVLSPVSLSAGAGTGIDIPLVALRRLTVNFTSSATFLDDGEGPATFVSFDTATPDDASKLFGIGMSTCLAVGPGRTSSVTGWVFGEGPHFVSGVLDDFALGVDDAPGSAISIDNSGTRPSIPAANEIQLPRGQYSATHTIDLNFVFPLDADAGAPTPFACSMLDAGRD